MKKVITVLAVCLSVCHCPSAFGQDTTRMQHIKGADKSEDESEGYRARPKKKRMRYHAEIGLEAGVYNDLFTNNGGISDMTLGWSAGIPVLLPLVGHLYFQTGLYYSVYGGEVFDPFAYGRPSVSGDQFWYVHSIELPLVLGLRFGRPRRSYYSSYIGIGGFVGYNIGGTSGIGSLPVGTDGKGGIQPFNYGLALNLGIEWRSGFFLQTKLRWGLADVSNDTNVYMCAASYGVALGWLFGNHGTRHIPHRDHYVDEKL